MSLTLTEAGLCTLVVDAGRPRSRALGVPLGGAADRASWQLGNALVGNPPDAAALEFALAGPAVTATVDLACVVAGAPFDVHIGDRRIPVGTTFTLAAGATLKIGGTRAGARGYLCVRGGIDAAVVLGSRASLEPLRRGVKFAVTAGRVGGHSLVDGPRSWTDGEVELRYLDGGQADWFDADVLPTIAYTVNAASNRMGVRLDGEPLRRPQRELVSEPVCPGTVQVVNDGRCVVLGVDGQTIGGYPKIGQVIAADWDRLGQLRPGQAVRFRRVTLDEAEAIGQDRAIALGRWLLRLSAACHSGGNCRSHAANT